MFRIGFFIGMNACQWNVERAVRSNFSTIDVVLISPKRVSVYWNLGGDREIVAGKIFDEVKDDAFGRV